MTRKFPAIIPSFAPETDDMALDRLLAPARFFDHPVDVLGAPNLNVPEKRAILAAWASDACAVESIPALRKPPGAKRSVAFDEIMEALRLLDSQAVQGRPVNARVATLQLDA
ncbi:hypothetical protein [Mesorhizobium australicum]|uniref:Uncharacterized protein n=1 Tax=Mesorhizobium australicum TaxID=536018 RepID=A0A1X7MYN5_9HYPH|nr:hypothetical protein [Mesorhizobium australicum]SMH30012.1 hypothetical protein SAMN02982922_0983 [Mesorhizobium australicum]